MIMKQYFSGVRSRIISSMVGVFADIMKVLCAWSSCSFWRNLFFPFLSKVCFDKLSGWNPYTSILYDHPKEEESSSSRKKRSSDSYITITPIPRLSYQPQTINALKTFKGRRNSTLGYFFRWWVSWTSSFTRDHIQSKPLLR